MKQKDLSIAEKAYIEEHSTKETWTDIFTLSARTNIDYEAIITYRRQLIGFARANKMLDKDFLAVIREEKTVERPLKNQDPKSDADLNLLEDNNNILKMNGQLLEKNFKILKERNAQLLTMIQDDLEADEKMRRIVRGEGESTLLTS